MDYISHGLWSYILFHKIKKPHLAVLFGLLPDSASWLWFALYKIIKDGNLYEPNLNRIPNWVFMLYNISHSLIVCFAIFAAVYLYKKRIPVYMWAWPIAITVDIFTHTKDFLPTPFLWPVSQWHFPGITWGTWKFMIVNDFIMVVLLFWILYKRSYKYRFK